MKDQSEAILNLINSTPIGNGPLILTQAAVGDKISLSDEMYQEIVADAAPCIISKKIDGPYVHVIITTATGTGIGMAIKSPTDKRFDLNMAVSLAIERALAALRNKQNGDPIRKNFNEFPKDWTQEQMGNLINCEFDFKSIYQKAA